MINYSAPDFCVHPPRSPRVKLGGFVHLPRLLDKARASAFGKLGDYVFPCPLDLRFFAFVGVSPEAFAAEVAQGRSDTEMLAWLMARLSPARLPHEINTWSEWLSQLAPGDVRRHTAFAEQIQTLAPGREDIVTYFDRLDLDDYVTYYCKA